MAPRITEDAQALDRIDDYLDNTQPHTHEAEVLGYSGSRFIVGVTFSDGEKRIYYVGPRGGIDCWIRANHEWAEHIASFLVGYSV